MKEDTFPGPDQIFPRTLDTGNCIRHFRILMERYASSLGMGEVPVVWWLMLCLCLRGVARESLGNIDQ